MAWLRKALKGVTYTDGDERSVTPGNATHTKQPCSGDTAFDDKNVVTTASPSYRTTRDMGHEICTMSSLVTGGLAALCRRYAA